MSHCTDDDLVLHYYGDAEAPRRAVGEDHLAIVQANDLEGQRQAQSQAPGLGREERPELVPGGFRREARTVVGGRRRLIQTNRA